MTEDEGTSPIDPLAYLPQRGGRLLGASFDILTAARGDLRRASLYIGVILLLTVGPLAILFVGFATQQIGLSDLATGSRGNLSGTAGLALFATITLAFLGYIVILVEGQAVAIILLAGRLAHRPITLRAAIVRSRVVFWRIIRGAFLIGVPLYALELIVEYPLTNGLAKPTEGANLFGSVVATIAGWPFVYLGTGIVLGDVQATEAARRSIRLVRARPWTALAIAVFAAIAGYLTSFGIGAADDVVMRLVAALGLDISGGSPSVLLAGTVVLVLVLAFGTLQFTVSAISIAPQVVAFLALTRYTGGIDQALAPDGGRGSGGGHPPVGSSPTFRWFRWWLVIPSAVATLLGLLALTNLTD